MTLTATPAKIELSEHVRLRLEIEAETGVTVSDVAYERALKDGDRAFQYRVVRSDQDLARPTGDGKLRWTYDFELEFVLPGEFELPAADVSFVDLRAAGANGETGESKKTADEQTVSTPTITVVVRANAKAVMGPEELRKITRLDPVELPTRWHYWRWLGPVIGFLIVIGVLMLLRRARRRQEQVAVQIPAHEWARQRIAALIGEDLMAKGRVQEFYYRISAILRGYIERRFALTAPDMTTEEFLNKAAGDHRFGSDMTEELGRFLSACDLVKYARHEPGVEESNAVVRAAGAFVERTREADVPPDGVTVGRSPRQERVA